MKILIIGGTGTISSAITRQLSESDHELWLLNRGTRKAEVPANVHQVVADIDDTEIVLDALGDETFVAVSNIFLPTQSCKLRMQSSTHGAIVSLQPRKHPNNISPR